MSTIPSSSQQYQRIQSFSDDLLFLIFAFFPAPDLLQVGRVNTLWHSIIEQKDELLYKHLTTLLWEGLSFNQAKEVNVLRKVEQLTLTALKRSLVGIDLSRCIEKKDFQRTLLAKLLFCNVMGRELKGEDARFKGKYLSMYYPDWSLEIPSYKASYYYTKNEITRKTINIYELCKIEWIFKFKNNADYYMDDGDEDGGSAGWRCRFNIDFTMSSTLQGQDYEWRFVEGNDGIRRIQVASYPALSSHRLPDGSWGMENMHVYFQQLRSIDVDDIPIIANTSSI
eukprot:gene14694-16312_t